MASQLDAHNSKYHASKFSTYEEAHGGQPGGSTSTGNYNQGMNFNYGGQGQQQLLSNKLQYNN